MINPTFLRTFLTLVELRSFTRTAEVLRMTQPGVSQHLKWLEEYYGTPLARRDRRTFELTDAGQRLVTYAQGVFAADERFRGEVGEDDPHKGLCRFASPGAFGLRLYSFLLELNRRHDGLAMHFAVAPNPSIVRDVLEERIDVGFVTKEPEEPGIEVTPFAQERLCLAVPKSLRRTTWAGLRELGYIDHPDGHHHTGRLLARNFAADYVGMEQFRVRGFSNQIARILEPVALGLGFTALPESACRAFAGRSALRLDPLKQQVVDQVYWIQKRGRVLPARFELVRGAASKALTRDL